MLSSTSPLRLGEWKIDLHTGELAKPGTTVRLQEQPLQILQILLERPGEVVSREELQRRIWPADTYVDFDHGLYSAVKRLRDTLGDDTENPKYIQTLSRRGYRLIARVAEAEQQKPDVSSEVPAEAANPALRHRWWIAGVLGGAAVFAVAVIVLYSRSSPPGLFTAPVKPVASIAVLPLENLSGDPEQEYFADGMTDELITDLAQFGNLRVISRTSVMHYKKTQKTLPQVARELNVDTIVEGTVARSGDRVRIRVQLVRAADDAHLWAEAYERQLGDVLLLQSDAARDIAAQVDIHVSSAPQPAHQRHIKPDAYEAYLKGRYFWTKRERQSDEKAITYFQQAIQLDPASALPYSGLADALLDTKILRKSSAEVVPQARAAAEKALQIDPDLPEAHEAMAGLLELYDWNWPDADREYRRALELNANYSTAHQLYAVYLVAMGRSEQAFAETEVALKLDPVSAFTYATSCYVYFFGRQYDRAIQLCNKAIEIDPHLPTAHGNLANIYLMLGNYDQVIEQIRILSAVRGIPQSIVTQLDEAYRRGGVRSFWQKNLRLRQNNQLTNSDLTAASIYAMLGDKDKAMQSLDGAYESRDQGMEFLKVDPAWDSLRSEPRFQSLLRRMALTN